MLNRRDQLHEVFCTLLGTRNVYFQPPESVRMKYPAIVYALNNIDSVYADDRVYLSAWQYSFTIIDKDPDSPLVEKAACLLTCKFVRHYKADNLNHWVFQLYY